MRNRKILICVIFLACCLNAKAFAKDDYLSTQESVGRVDTIVLEKPENGNFATNFVNSTEQRSEEVQKKEEQGYETSTEIENKKHADSVQHLQREDKIVPVFDLKGGVQKETPPVVLEKETTFFEEWLHGDYATGNWLGLRPKLEEHGITIGSSILYSPFGKTRGGMIDNTRRGAGYTLYNLDLTADTEKMGLWKGGTFYALYQRKKGMGLTEDHMGDYQVLDGWDFREMNQLSEVWYQQTFFDEKARVKFGKQDANSDFCALSSGFDFVNTSFSIMPTVPIPTYPDPTFGFMAEVSPKEWLSLRDGVYHKNGSAFNISEIEVSPTIKNKPGRYFTGFWVSGEETIVDTDELDENDEYVTRTYNRNFGWYAAFEQMVYKENKDDKEDAQGLTVFGQIGMTPSARNEVDKYFGAGLHYKGLIPKRDEDIAGVGVAMANFSRRLDYLYGMQGQETVIECFYRAQVTPWFCLQPDVQFIMNPSGSYPSSVAIGLRSVVTF